MQALGVGGGGGRGGVSLIELDEMHSGIAAGVCQQKMQQSGAQSIHWSAVAVWAVWVGLLGPGVGLIPFFWGLGSLRSPVKARTGTLFFPRLLTLGYINPT